MWIKARIGIKGNEEADIRAKRAASMMPARRIITEGGVRQYWKKRREASERTGVGRTIRWNRKALHNYAQCRTGMGRIGKLRYILDSWVDPGCRWCGDVEETGAHLA